MHRPREPALRTLPVVVMLVEDACDARCLMCGQWRSKTPQRLQLWEIERVLDDLSSMGTELVALSGGEPLLHPAIGEIMTAVEARGFDQTLITNGLRLGECARLVAASCTEVVVSLDGPPEVHDLVRGVRGAYDRLRAGVEAVRGARPEIRLRARCTVQRANHRHLVETARSAQRLGLDGISFLPVDSRGGAFGLEPCSLRGLLPDDPRELERSLARLVDQCRAELDSGFVVESETKLRQRVVQPLIDAARGRPGTSPHCNAPWVAAVIAADGSVRPCFFQTVVGSVRTQPLAEAVNSDGARAMRERLRITRDPVCHGCVCPLWWPPRPSIPRRMRPPA